MKFIKIALPAVLLCIAQQIVAQVNNPASIKYASELNKLYPDADVYLENNTTELSFSVSDEKYNDAPLKIKAYKTTEYFSLKYNVSAGVLESYNSFSSIDKMLAYTKNKEIYSQIYPAQIDKAIESGGIFHSDARYKYMALDFPSKGAFQKTHIVKSFNDYKFIDAFYFHQEQPQKTHTIAITIPGNVQVDVVEFNFEGYKIIKNIQTDPKTLNRTIVYQMENVAPYTGERGSTGASMSLPHIVVVVKSYSLKGAKIQCFENFNAFYKFLHTLNGEVEKNETEVKELSTKIIAGKTTDEEKVKALYYWVQDNIRYIAFEYGIAGFKPMSPKSVIDNKYGDCKAVANLLASMLRAQGYDAKFVWIHTNYTKYVCTLPYLGEFNHAICVLYLNNKTYFLDCTESYAAFGENAYRIQSRPAMVENGDEYKIEKIPLEDINSSKQEENVTVKIVGDKLIGECATTAKGDLKNHYLRLYHFEKSENKRDFFKKYYNKSNSNILVTDVTTSDLSDRGIPFSSKYSFELNNQIFKDSTELFVNLEFDNMFGKISKDTLRLTDYTYDMILNNEIAVTLTMPEGYKASELPPAFEVHNEYCSINLSYALSGTKVIYKKSFVFPTGVIPRSKAAEWARIQKDLKKYYTHQVTLVK